ncbi:hypothetical protein TRFO_24361 [Tritrichomonas foetus]|uniref:Dymeclin n=1 Tax=Tritrichomonas foetus TaxID=1144522 RepID=A0A1J4K877_9EUKA|nr:hypothetical protein TRFO_24361 [Tritrichomonas foetus]|eukprot:OHT07411.1 hypothetical protein TRFO_24361 [Tritrichomonas foetus]
MGSSQSVELVEPPKILQHLGTFDIVEDSKYWGELFSWKFPKSNMNANNQSNITPTFRDSITQIYSKKPYNFHLAIKMCGLELEKIIKNDHKLDHEIETVTNILYLILPTVISAGCHISVLNQCAKGKIKLGAFLAKNLMTFLHYKDFTIEGENNDSNWYSKSSDIDSIRNLDQNRLLIVEILLLLKTVGVSFREFDTHQLVKSIQNLLSFYLNSPSRRNYFTIRRLLQTSFILMLLLKTAVFSEETIQIYQPIINTADRKNYSEEFNTFLLPMIFNFISIAEKDDSIIDSSNLSLIVNILHICDQLKDISSMSALAMVLSFPSVSISLNTACTSFESDVPVHRGSYADIVIELVSRQSMSMLKTIVLVVVNVIPYASNLSYGSAISIFKLLTVADANKDSNSVKMIVSAIHYTVNRSVRENIPLVILVMKNSKLLMNINREFEGFEECEQLVSFVKNVNQELKQLGPRFRSSELEKFFNDPSCEHFALPVLRPPQIDLDISKEIDHQVKNIAALYAINQIGVKPKTRRGTI